MTPTDAQIVTAMRRVIADGWHDEALVVDMTMTALTEDLMPCDALLRRVNGVYRSRFKIIGGAG